LQIDLRAVEQIDDTGIDVPDLVWLRGSNTDGGLGWINTAARPAGLVSSHEHLPSVFKYLEVERRLLERWSPQQIAARLISDYPSDPSMVSRTKPSINRFSFRRAGR